MINEKRRHLKTWANRVARSCVNGCLAPLEYDGRMSRCNRCGRLSCGHPVISEQSEIAVFSSRIIRIGPRLIVSRNSPIKVLELSTVPSMGGKYRAITIADDNASEQPKWIEVTSKN